MHPEIAVIAPDRELFNVVNELKDDFSEPIHVALGHSYEAVKVARNLVQKGIRVLISRGGTTTKIRRSDIAVPVIDISFTGYDIIQLLDEARKISDRIAVVGFDVLVNGAKFIGSFLDLNIMTFLAQTDDAFVTNVRKAKALGFEVVVGSKLAVELAEAREMKGILLRSQKPTVRCALEEGIKLLESLRKEREWGEKLQNIMDFMSDGIIAVDEHGRITHLNSSISKAFEIEGKGIVGQPVGKLVDDLDINRALERGEVLTGKILKFNGINYVINSTPIRIDQSAQGAIITVQKLDKIQTLEQKVRRKLYRKGLFAKYKFSDIVGRNPSLQQVIKRARHYAAAESSILIQGESGTGKEIFAQSIHNESTRYKGPFVAINCGALPEHLLESELFGYVEGAFTGAKKGGKPGLFELAHGGTLFLDEIGEISNAVQARLLRVLEEKQVMRIGDDRLIPVDVRILCATNKDLKLLVKQGLFRQELYYRINVLKLELPPLRERKDDIPLLLEHYLKGYYKKSHKNPPKINPEAVRLLMNFHWPGNVRELKNIVERLVITCTDCEITCRDVLESMEDILEKKDHLPVEKTASLPLAKQQELNLILKVLKETNGNKVEAARKLGISRTTLWRRLKNRLEFIENVS
ncbi:MAG: sigma 54-interacting transcriptional regulator [Deltaproteobacteria bacterium]|nr:sigma 54-interacting transcriptional regulator [Deltaproteobacteria bacterium]